MFPNVIMDGLALVHVRVQAAGRGATVAGPPDALSTRTWRINRPAGAHLGAPGW